MKSRTKSAKAKDDGRTKDDRAKNHRANAGRAKIRRSGSAAGKPGTSKSATRPSRRRAVKSQPRRQPTQAARRTGKTGQGRTSGLDSRVRGLFSHLRVTPATSGSAALVAVAAVDGGKLKVATSRIEQMQQQPAAGNRKRTANGLAADQRKRLAQIVEAVASPHRLGILLKLLEGPSTYKALQRTTGLNVGPLYHHVNRLRGEGLVGPRERDLYLLTVAGRNLVLALMAALPLISVGRSAV